MEKEIPKILILPGVKAVYRNGESIYQYREYQGDTGVIKDDDLRTNRYKNRDKRL
ncbi:MAG: hypothetical protein JXR85_12430 [Deltaproteobacteria bacterium]|nr:hypothetical protein [Deltaproteobacteria bacterium]